jgi:hypothetical protein
MLQGHVRGHVSTRAATTASSSHSTCNSSSSSTSGSSAAAAVRQPQRSATVSGSCAVDSDEALDSLELLQHIEQQSADVSIVTLLPLLITVMCYQMCTYLYTSVLRLLHTCSMHHTIQ